MAAAVAAIRKNRRLSRLAQEEAAKTAFDSVDADGSGEVDANELFLAVGLLGLGASWSSAMASVAGNMTTVATNTTMTETNDRERAPSTAWLLLLSARHMPVQTLAPKATGSPFEEPARQRLPERSRWRHQRRKQNDDYDEDQC